MTIEDAKVDFSDTSAKFAGRYIASVKLRHVNLSGEGCKCRYEHSQWRTEGSGFGGGFKSPSRNSEGPLKSCQTQPDLKTVKNC